MRHYYRVVLFEENEKYAIRNGGKMKRVNFGFIIIFILLTISTSLIADTNNNGVRTLDANNKYINKEIGIDIGAIFPYINSFKSGVVLGIYQYNKKKLFTPISGIVVMFNDIDKTGKYTDYTSLMGSDNVFNDREDGDVYKSSYSAYGLTSTLKIKNHIFFIDYGIIQYKKNYYRALYDPLEILGNNGYYYIESNISNDKRTGFFGGMKYKVNLSPKTSIFKWYLNLGVELTTISEIENLGIRIDLGLGL